MSSAVESCNKGYRVKGKVSNNSVDNQTIVCGENGLWNITGCEIKGRLVPFLKVLMFKQKSNTYNIINVIRHEIYNSLYLLR